MKNKTKVLLKYFTAISLFIFGTVSTHAADIVDNTDVGFGVTGNWTSSTFSSELYGTDYSYASAGTGNQTATWTISLGADGQYSIDAWWTASSNRASNAPYFLYNNGVLIDTVRVDQRSNGGQFNVLGSYPLQAGTVTIVLSDDADGIVIADAVQVTYLGPPQNAAPNGNIDSPGGNLAVVVGDSVTFSGSGTDWDNDLPLSYLWQFGAGSGIADSSEQSPTVQFNTPGTFTVSLTVTDALGLADPTPAEITVTVQSLSGGLVVDNTDAAFSAVGNWSSSTYVPEYYGTDYLYSSAGSGTRTATWTFAVGTAGQYEIAAQWTAAQPRALNATYLIQNNGVDLDAVRVDQGVNGGQFNVLGSYPLQAGTLEGVLSDAASDVVIADAVSMQLVNTASSIKILTSLERDLSTSSDVTLSVSAVNFPANWMVDLVLDGDIAGAIRFNSTLFQHTLTGLSLGEHTIQAIMVDESGTQQSGYSDQISFGVGKYLVAFGDSITEGYLDDLPGDDISADGRDTGGGYPPVLNDLLTANKGYPHTIVNAGVGGEISYDGRQRIGDVILLHPNSQIYLIQFGTNDAGGGVASGMGLSPSDPGYVGSFKDNMQGIIDIVLAAGKTPVLAKVPATNYIEPTKTTVNNLIQEYNVVIDELVSTNGITVSPPDFYSYFDAHHEELADALHPNGVGYRSMAQLWFESLSTF